MGYTKLFSEIVLSTVWQQPGYVKVVWVTMLAMKDRWHVVSASIPGLAKAAGITIEECEKAIAYLSSPDAYSRTKDFDGRRIEEVDGGWRILNGEKYRNKMSLDERREYNRIKQKEYYYKKKTSNSSVQSSTNQYQPVHIQKQIHNQKHKKEELYKAPLFVPKGTDFNGKDFEKDFWSLYPPRNGTKAGKGKAYGEWLKLLPDERLKAVESIQKQKKNYDQCKSKNLFVSEFPDAFRWLRDKRFNDEISEIRGEKTWKEKFMEGS